MRTSVLATTLCVLLGCTGLSCEQGRVARNRIVQVVPESRYPERPAAEPGTAVAFTKVATTPETRERGLMFARSLGPDRGMLFIYPDPRPLSFWMKNVEIPLSICFADAGGRVVRILEMAPAAGRETPTERYESLVPALYALEMNRGWFTEKGVRVGDVLRLDPEILALPIR